MIQYFGLPGMSLVHVLTYIDPNPCSVWFPCLLNVLVFKLWGVIGDDSTIKRNREWITTYPTPTGSKSRLPSLFHDQIKHLFYRIIYPGSVFI